MSSTWRDLADQSRTRVAPRRLSKRVGERRGSLVLPGAVMSVLGAAFLAWFLTGAPLPGGATGHASVSIPIRPPVQTPQIAAAPALADPKATDPTPPLAPLELAEPLPEPDAPVSEASALLPLALQPTPQISTPAPMKAVVSENQQIVAPRMAQPMPPERRAAAPQMTPPAAPPVAAPVARAPAEAPAAEPDRPTRGFSIVLASVETESQARAQLGQLKQKFGSLLGARRLNYHRTKQEGAFLWHIRSTGLSEGEAEELCEQIERAGGDCAAVEQ